jgi:hypothetical protein
VVLHWRPNPSVPWYKMDPESETILRSNL